MGESNFKSNLKYSDYYNIDESRCRYNFEDETLEIYTVLDNGYVVLNGVVDLPLSLWLNNTVQSIISFRDKQGVV